MIIPSDLEEISLSGIVDWRQRESGLFCLGPHPLTANLDEVLDTFLNRALEKKYAVIIPHKDNEFSRLKSVLRYLQLCVHSMIVDHIRAREQATTLRAEDNQAVIWPSTARASNKGGCKVWSSGVGRGVGCVSG